MKTITQIVEETIATVKHHGRALGRTPDGAISCMYRPDNHPGCAVGRCMIPSKYDSEMEFETCNEIHHIAGESCLDAILMKPYRCHPKSFWRQLQMFHDGSIYWDDNKLLRKGRERANQIINTYEN